MKTKLIKLSKIKISPLMEMPREQKMKWKYGYYKRVGKFECEIIVDKKYNLIDGYTTYLLAKMFGYKKINVKVK